MGKIQGGRWTSSEVVALLERMERAVEKAAGEFFVSKLEPSTAADALGFAAERVECGEHAKALHEKCVEYAIEHFAALSREASFLSLPVETIASFIASDDLPVVLAGNANGAIRTGRHAVYSHETPMSNLFLNMLDIMGAPVDRLGDSTGRLKGLA